MRNQKIVSISFASLCTLLFQALPALAVKLDPPLGDINIQQLIGKVIHAILGITGSFALLIFVWGGFLWMTARGDEKQVKQGWDSMTWAGLGLIIIFGAYVIVNFIMSSLSPSLQ